MRRKSPADRFLLGRVLLRRVIGGYLKIDPLALALRENINGKPELATPSTTPFSFNLSHAGAKAVLAVTRASTVGVDFVSMDRADTIRRISKQFFSASERQYLDALGDARASYALKLWALKESVVKAKGLTVWDGLENLSFVIESSRIDGKFLQHTDDGHWKLAAGRFKENHFLAVAVRSQRNETKNSLCFRTFSLGREREDANGFKPELRS